MKIKICGITRIEDARRAAELGADFLGFIFIGESPRAMTAEQAKRIRDAVSGPKFVGVFANEHSSRVNEIAHEVGLDFVQLHGAETDDDIREINVAVIKAMRVGETLPDTKAHPNASWLLFDTLSDRRGGGTGRRFDWSLLSLYERQQPFLLAGGLSPDNVAAAISLVRPDAVDVASGVESEPGIKDHAKLEKFFERVRRS
jgi:phosphoribosylanthranilate isomerase